MPSGLRITASMTSIAHSASSGDGDGDGSRRRASAAGDRVVAGSIPGQWTVAPAATREHHPVMDRRVLWPRDRAREVSDGLTIDGIGLYDDMTPCMVDRPRGTADWLLMHFHTPVVVHHAGELRTYPPHTFFLWSAGSRHTFGNTRRGWTHSWMHCHGSVVDRAIAAASIPLDRPIAFPDSYAIDRHLENIYAELTAFAAPDPVIVESYTRIWIRSIDREANPAAHPTRVPARILKAIRYIESRLAEPISLADLAHQALLSVSRFSSEFRAHVGASPIEYVLHLRLRHATHLLRDRNLKIADIATRVGFADAFYFSRMFRRAFGVSPMQYRQRLAEA